MTAEVCTSFASQNDWQFAGVENGDECYVANVLTGNNLSPTVGCTTPCAGDPVHELCGGSLRLDLYQDSAWVAPSKQALEDALAALLNLLQEFQEALGDWLDLVVLYNVENSNSTTSSSGVEKRDPGDGSVTPGEIQSARSTALSYEGQLGALDAQMV
jgi:hypothetical protein